MINYICYLFQRPEKGWDPVPKEYACEYAKTCYNQDIKKTCEDVISFVGPLEGIEICDLGAGPGQFSNFFYQEGGRVTWYDISKNYLSEFENKFPKVDIAMKIAYMDDVSGAYDLIFNRVCWYYCINDKKFAQSIYNALSVAGKGYFIIPNEGYLKSLTGRGFKRFVRLAQFYLNNIFGFKVGHPMLTNRRISKIFTRLPWSLLEIEVRGRETVVRCVK